MVLTTHSQYPTVTLADLKNLEPQAKAFVGTDDLILRTDQSIVGSSTQSIWLIKPERLITWLGTEKTNDRIMLTISQDKIRDYLLKSVAPFVNLEPTPPRFMIQNGKVISWQNGLSGRQIDATTTAFNIARNFLNGGRDTAITIQELANEELLSNNDFKIKEIVGTGHSQFTGSPPNRIHNIKVGAAAMSGLLIKPGEEFSLVKNLGDVDATSTGYLPELVIKGNKTTPEFGGGLCQIGTTIFRAALSSGLPITYRQNHSYRVSYYEPAGMDAAVYIPKPDVRFINDTGNYILIQSRIVKNDLYFDFWGVKDGRTATTTTPVIYNIVKPEPMKTIISTDLAPGQKKCTESSHNGADVYFDYTVTYPEGVTTTPIQGRRFKSHYVPWQAICLIGATSTASSTLGVSPETGAATSSNQKAAESSTASSSTP